MLALPVETILAVRRPPHVTNNSEDVSALAIDTHRGQGCATDDACPSLVRRIIGFIRHGLFARKAPPGLSNNGRSQLIAEHRLRGMWARRDRLPKQRLERGIGPDKGKWGRDLRGRSVEEKGGVLNVPKQGVKAGRNWGTVHDRRESQIQYVERGRIEPGGNGTDSLTNQSTSADIAGTPGANIAAGRSFVQTNPIPGLVPPL